MKRFNKTEWPGMVLEWSPWLQLHSQFPLLSFTLLFQLESRFPEVHQISRDSASCRQQQAHAFPFSRHFHRLCSNPRSSADPAARRPLLWRCCALGRRGLGRSVVMSL
ncbi:hypothetical protein E2C01_087132 [Portunus trituberculatus]|uniref:Uncharacterized protein n=1 Tax=Portunus trituberculatus TaxID=210409 RepID=A0A5B7J5S5_PORTR|nr:hypothetical protein [Portunus trituberculatus]